MGVGPPSCALPSSYETGGILPNTRSKSAQRRIKTKVCCGSRSFVALWGGDARLKINASERTCTDWRLERHRIQIGDLVAQQ